LKEATDVGAVVEIRPHTEEPVLADPTAYVSQSNERAINGFTTALRGLGVTVAASLVCVLVHPPPGDLDQTVAPFAMQSDRGIHHRTLDDLVGILGKAEGEVSIEGMDAAIGRMFEERAHADDA